MCKSTFEIYWSLTGLLLHIIKEAREIQHSCTKKIRTPFGSWHRYCNHS